MGLPEYDPDRTDGAYLPLFNEDGDLEVERFRSFLSIHPRQEDYADPLMDSVDAIAVHSQATTARLEAAIGLWILMTAKQQAALCSKYLMLMGEYGHHWYWWPSEAGEKFLKGFDG